MKTQFRSIVAIFSAVVVIAQMITMLSANVAPASAFFGDVPTTINQNGVTVKVEGIAEILNSTGTYSATYRYSVPSKQDVSFVVEAETDRCDEPNGYTHTPRGGCPENTVLTYPTITLNASNNWTHELTLSVTQAGNKPCGSFQTDLRHNYTNHFAYATSIYHTGKDLNNPSQCTVASPSPSPSVSPSPSPSPRVSPSASPSPRVSPSPSPSPSPSVSPSPRPSASPSVAPSPSPSASTIQCPVGKVAKVVDSTIICVAQSQTQQQTQTQQNDQRQAVTQTVTATGGSSSSSSSSSSSVHVTVANPSATPTPTPTPSATPTTVVVTTTTPQVVAQVKGAVTELPKTGLPLAALALGGLLPAGFGLKKFTKKDTEEISANSIWTEKQLNS